jgi:hypothetical protein
MMRGMRYLIDSAIEGCFVYLRRFRETAQLTDELKRRSVNFIRRRRWTEVVKCFDGSAHVGPSAIVDQRSTTSCFADHVDNTDFVSLQVTQNFL